MFKSREDAARVFFLSLLILISGSHLLSVDAKSPDQLLWIKKEKILESSRVFPEVLSPLDHQITIDLKSRKNISELQLSLDGGESWSQLKGFQKTSELNYRVTLRLTDFQVRSRLNARRGLASINKLRSFFVRARLFDSQNLTQPLSVVLFYKGLPVRKKKDRDILDPLMESDLRFPQLITRRRVAPVQDAIFN